MMVCVCDGLCFPVAVCLSMFCLCMFNYSNTGHHNLKICIAYSYEYFHVMSVLSVLLNSLAQAGSTHFNVMQYRRKLIKPVFNLSFFIPHRVTY